MMYLPSQTICTKSTDIFSISRHIESIIRIDLIRQHDLVSDVCGFNNMTWYFGSVLKARRLEMQRMH